MTEEQYWFWLCNIPHMWQGNLSKILHYLHTPKEVWEASSKLLEKIPGCKKEIIVNIKNSKKAEYLQKLEVKWNQMEKNKIQFFYPTHPQYPSKLRNLYDYPYSLYCKGELPREDIPVLAMVGARACSEYGKKIAEEMAEDLSRYGVHTISGMAYGIDSHSHWGSLKGNGKTYAVLGSGIDVCYPKANKELYDAISEHGAVLSEYPLGEAPISWHFPLRNRLISALSSAVLVVEAKKKSGSFITVDYALEQGKSVMAIPGRISDPLSEGCHYLIRSGAGICRNVWDILEDMNILAEDSKNFQKKMKLVLEKELEVVYSVISLLPKSTELIAKELHMDIRDVVNAMVKLQLLGLVEEPVRGFFVRKYNTK